MGRPCRVVRREHDWSFDFGDETSLAVTCPWRIVTADGIAFADQDHGQWFGLPAPVDGVERTNGLLEARRVERLDIDPQTADIRIAFTGGLRLDVFNNSCGYEGWTAGGGAGSQGLAVIGLGGGQLAIF